MARFTVKRTVGARIAGPCQDQGEEVIWIERIKVSTSPVYNLAQLAERDALTKIVLETLEQARVEPGNLPGEIKEMLDVLPPEVRSEVESDWGESQHATVVEDVEPSFWMPWERREVGIMRFDRLHIPAFGPFTNLDLIFPAQGGDLHVIYGPNEAGKSSLLRAFRDLLFGIHGQSPDNFLHDYKELRIKGEVLNRAGEKLTFQRRKGNKNTLLDAEGNPLPDNSLIPFLGSVDQEYFSAMFGLGTRELREGAEQLLHGKGDIGNALFSASMGGTPVQLVLAALTEESDRLFRGRSTASVSIRPTANEYKELLRKSRDVHGAP